tara:strand:- start:1925 stop:2365 length:441 start_codon:yes stop_codon:yes gene_type:complete
MIKANVFVEFPKWRKKISNPKKYIQKKIKKLNKIAFLKNKKQEFSILLTESKKLKRLNKIYRKRNKATDVLSFPIKNIFKNDFYIGDIAISFEFIDKRSLKTSFQNEFDKTWVHGYLHLINYDHKKNDDFKRMNNKEKLILKKINN